MMRNIAGESVLIPLGEAAKKIGDMGMPNETFTYLWEQFKTPKTIEEAAAAAAEEFEGDPKQITADIEKFVTESLEFGTLVEA